MIKLRTVSQNSGLKSVPSGMGGPNTHPNSTRANLALGALAAFFSLLVFLSNESSSIEHDLSSYLAPVANFDAAKSGLYSTYLDIKPPGIFMLLFPWVSLFGFTLLSLSVLNVTLVFLTLFMTFRIFGALVQVKVQFLFSIAYGVITVGSATYGEMLVSTELVGNLFVSSALCLIWSTKKTNSINWWAAGMLAALAMQTKEVFLFAAVLVLTSALTSTERKTGIFGATGGLIVGTLSVIGFLMVTGELGDYLYVLELKRQLFSVNSLLSLATGAGRDYFQIAFALSVLWLLAAPLSVLYAISALAPTPSFILRSRPFDEHPKLKSVSAGYLAALLAFLWQGKPFFGHYIASLLLPIFLICISAYLSKASSTKAWSPSLWILASALIPLGSSALGFLTTTVSSTTPQSLNLVHRFEGEEKVRHEYSIITKNVPPGHCIQSAYGWAAGADYLYSRRSPCTSLFLPNLIGDKDNLIQKYRQDLQLMPPAAIIYKPKGADLDVREFEKSIFPWRKVLAKCYKRAPNTPYWFPDPKSGSPSLCIKTVVKSHSD